MPLLYECGSSGDHRCSGFAHHSRHGIAPSWTQTSAPPVACDRGRALREEPVSPLIVDAAASDTAIVVAAVLRKHANGLLVALPDDVGGRVAAAQIHEAANDAQDLAEVARALQPSA